MPRRHEAFWLPVSVHPLCTDFPPFPFLGGGANMSLFSLHHSAIFCSIDQMLRLEVVTKSSPRSCGSVFKWLAAFLSPCILLYEMEL